MENALRQSERTDTIPAERTTRAHVMENRSCSHKNDKGQTFLYPIGHKVVQCTNCKMVNNGKVPGEKYYILKTGKVIR